MPIIPGETSSGSAGLVERSAQVFAASVPTSPADDGLFGPRSVTWRLTGTMTTPVIAIRALLLQALHPLAMAGVDQHSTWRANPGARLASTSAYEVTVSVGDTAAASAAAARVRKVHSFVTGTDPATGRPYAAGDPALLLWVHNALVESTLACVRLYGSISAGDEDRYVREQVAAAELIGIPAGQAPRTVADLDRYFETIRPELMCTPAAASATTYLLEYLEDSAGLGDDDDPEAAELLRDITDAAIVTLPHWAITLYAEKLPAIAAARDRFGPMSASAQLAARQSLGVLDAVFLGEPGVLEARQRLQRRIRSAQ
jgi:uncharacterized protein (DUF2236 family)